MIYFSCPTSGANNFDSLVIVTQPDHAFFSGEVLSLWREDGLPAHPRRQDLLFATREHDNGWREPDAAPRVDPTTGRPYSFLTFPAELKREVWRRGVDRFAETRPYAALLITEHALQLHQEHQDEVWQRFLAEIGLHREGLLEKLTVSEREMSRDYRFLELADLISLAVCSRWDRTFQLHGTEFRFLPEITCAPQGVVRMKPFPLAGATTFKVRYRAIPDRRYEGDADLAVELACARWQQAAVRLEAEPS